MRAYLVPIATLALATACTDGGADADGDGTITAEEVANEMNEVALEPGQWENTFEIVDVEIEGLPEGAPAGMMDSMIGQKSTTKSCMTEEEAKNPGADFFSAQEQADCEISEFNMSGGAIKSVMNCKDMGGAPGDMAMSMDGQYGPSSYDMTMSMTGDAGPMKIKMAAKNSGKRIGDCPAG